MKLAIAIGFLLTGSIICSADVVTLNDGTRIEGKIKRSGDDMVIVSPAGVETTVKADQVQSIEVARSGGVDTPAAASDKLNSLRHVAENLTDLNQIVARYHTFIDQNAGSPALDDASKDLAAWQDRLDRGMVKVGTRWVTTEQRDQLRDASMAQALQARDLLHQGKLKEGDALLQKAIADDPGNACALYLRGVALYQQGQFAEAKKCFEAVNTLAPNHGPTLNNLAVLLWKQKAFTASMNMYDQAMASAPGARDVLNNVAEALSALPEDQRDSAAAKKAALRFAEQDAALQKSAAESGWFRWGATWVTAKQLDDLKAAEAKIQDQLDVKKDEFNQTTTRIGQLDAEIDANRREMTRLDSSRYQVDQNGNQIQYPLPPAYMQLQLDNQKLALDRQALATHLDDLRAQARRIQKDLPVPQFSGVQAIIGIEATPLPAPPPGTTPPNDRAATTQPSAPPATRPFGN